MKFNNILKSAVVTEKSSKEIEQRNKYTFYVTKSATKGQIKDAIEALYKVVVEKVNLSNTGVKKKRSLTGKRKEYYRLAHRKAVIDLKSGNSIKIFESKK